MDLDRKIQMSEFKFESSNDKKRFLPFFVSYISVTYLETDLSTVLESLGHTGHVGMLG